MTAPCIFGMALQVHPYMAGIVKVAAKSGNRLFISQELLDQVKAADTANTIELGRLMASVRVVDVGDWPMGVQYAHPTM